MLLALLLMIAAAEDAHRAALAHFAAGRLMAATDRPGSAAKELEAAQKADPAAPDPKRELVKVYADLGRDAAAIRAATAVLEADPQDHATARRLGRLYADGRRFREASAAFTAAADSLRATAVERLALLRDAGRADADAGDWASAATTLGRAVTLVADRQAELRKSPRFESDAELDAESGAVHEQLAAALTGAKRFADADAAYRAAARLFTQANDPARAARLGWHRARVLAAAGRPADAVAVMEQFLALKPTTLPPYTDYADWLRAAGRGVDATAKLTALADRFPGEPRIRWVAAAEAARIDPAAGEARFRPLIDKSADPALAELFVRAFTAAGRAGPIVVALRPPAGEDDDNTPDPKGGDWRRAVTAAVKAESAATPLLLAAAGTASGWPSEVWGLVGFLAERANRLPDAETALRKGFAADPYLFNPLYRLLERQRRWRDMVELCHQVEGLPPTAWVPRTPGKKPTGPPLVGVYIAGPYAELGEDQRAVEAIDAASGKAANRLAVRLEKARVLLLLGRPQPALAECEAVAEEADPALLREVRIVRSQCHLAGRDFAASERELRAQLDDDPDDALVLNNLGYHLADEGRDLPAAERLVRRAVELDRAERRKRGDAEGESGTYLDSLGWVQFKRGDLPGAKATLEAALKSVDAAADPTVWDHLGDVRFRLGDAAGARAAWAKADERYTNSHAGRQFGRQAEVKRKLTLVP